MPAAYLASSATPRSRRRRAASLGMAVLAHLIVVLLLLRAAPSTEPPLAERETSFQLLPDAGPAQPAAKPVPRPARAKAAAAAAAPPAAAPAATAPQPTRPTPDPVPPPVPMLPSSMELFDAADISKIKSAPRAGEGEEGDQRAATGSDSGAVYGPGQGPGGQRLYNAEWYIEPTHAQLAGYTPPGVVPGSWAMIACRTVDDYHVENCRALGESPAGSGLARAMRLAAWQFRVLPPRLGGRKLIGAWVRIRIDFTVQGAAAR